MRFFHLSDLHIGKQLHHYNLREDQEHILSEIISYAEALRPDAVVIAGMGGETIAGILQAAPWVRTRAVELILQPMSTQPELRRWLADNGMEIRTERLAREGDSLYVVMQAGPGEMTLTPGECWAGRQSRDPLRGEYLARQLSRLDRALAGMALARGEQVEQRRRELEEIRRQVADMKEEWQKWQ